MKTNTGEPVPSMAPHAKALIEACQATVGTFNHFRLEPLALKVLDELKNLEVLNRNDGGYFEHQGAYEFGEVHFHHFDAHGRDLGWIAIGIDGRVNLL